MSRVYDKGRTTAVTHVDLSVARGESVAITGPSGSGKSTLLHLLCGLDRPTAGRVLVDGRTPPTPDAWAGLRAHRIGMVFQAFHLLPTLTACENVEVPMFGVLAGASARRTRALALLDEVGLAGRADHRPSELSGGERQRVAIARSLANNPDLLLADEPTGSLDTHTAATILRVLTGVHRARRTALVIVTHGREIADCCERQLQMVDGRLITGGSAS